MNLHHFWSSGAPEQHVISRFTHRTAVDLWLQEALEGRTDPELEAFILYSTKSLPTAKLQGGRVFVI